MLCLGAKNMFSEAKNIITEGKKTNAPQKWAAPLVTFRATSKIAIHAKSRQQLQ